MKNTGDNRVIDEVRAVLASQSTLDIATPALSLYAFGELKELLDKVAHCRLVMPTLASDERGLFGGNGDRPLCSQLNARFLARQLAAWLEKKVEPRSAPKKLPQSLIAIGDGSPLPARV